jgi:hypothetical protein
MDRPLIFALNFKLDFTSGARFRIVILLMETSLPKATELIGKSQQKKDGKLLSERHQITAKLPST